MKLVLLFLFLLIINQSFSQESCTTADDCALGPLDPICQSSTPQCIDGSCFYEPIPDCCSSNETCELLTPGACVIRYECNLDTNTCEPVMKECENGQPCSDFCITDELKCENKSCIASDDPDIDSTCQIAVEFGCEKPANKCLEAFCAYNEGCIEFDQQCSDYLGCTTDVCASADIGCAHSPIANCIECYGEGCITEDACLPSLCVEYDLGNLRGDGPGFYCKITSVNCTTNDPCLINGVCVQGECEYENICSSEETTAVTTTSATTTATTTSATITSATTSQVTTIATTASTVATTTASITTGSVTSSSSSTLGSSESDEYEGPKYPNCLDCKDLNCERMGRRCKYLKSYNKDCYEDGHQEKKFKHKHQHHNNPHGNSHHQNPHGNQHGNAHHQNPHGNVHHQSIGHFNHHISPHQQNNGGYGHHSSKYINYNNDNNNGGGNRNYERDRQGDYNGNYDDDDEFLIFNNIRYPRRLGPFDCCPYTPTCY